MVEFLEFCECRRLATRVAASVAPIVVWVDSTSVRGKSLPVGCLRSLIYLSEVIGINIPINNQSVKVSKKGDKKRKQMQSPMAPMRFLIKLGLMACDRPNPFGLRLFGYSPH